jgi:hypothetical protein
MTGHAKRMSIRHKCLYLSLLECFYVFCCSTIQSMKSSWKGTPFKGSIEELSKQVWERGKQVDAC